MSRKLNLEEHLQNYEERLFVKKLVDTAEKAKKSFLCCSTNFLDPAEQELAYMAMEEMKELSYRWESGFPDGERRVLVMAPEEWQLEEWDEIVVLKLSWNGKYAKKISHRDVLGSLMGLGIEREMTGDIKVEEDSAYVGIMKTMADFVMLNLERVGSAPVSIEISEDSIQFEDRYKEISGTVASCRLDSIFAEAFRLSRNEAQETIRSGKVRVNHKQTESVSFELGEGDLISAKGFGRARLASVNGKTKKDRWNIVIWRYL